MVIFVIQKHFATNLHYDFRLEIDKVLKSWAVPKQPPKRAKLKRLAVQTPDHPFSYANFQGVIPEGEYGAGKVEIWDKGKFENVTEKDGKKISVSEAYKKGHITFILKGKKLKGTYSLIKFKNKNWLLFKNKTK